MLSLFCFIYVLLLTQVQLDRDCAEEQRERSSYRGALIYQEAKNCGAGVPHTEASRFRGQGPPVMFKL